VISNKRVAGMPLINIFSEEDPGDGFRPAEDNLENVFFAQLNGLIKTDSL
jgi:hypothetical protein